MATPDTYRGWSISFDPPPIPHRGFDWQATHSEYDAWDDGDGWQSNGLAVQAGSRDALIAEIDAVEAERMTMTQQQNIAELIARWDSGDGMPYKGELIDMNAYDPAKPDIGCMCAQGQVLHLIGGWSVYKLDAAEQANADREVAKLLNISIAHAILLRNVNDKIDGAPSIVLTDPAKVLGDQAHILLAFWLHLDAMTGDDWLKVAAAGAAAGAAARDAAGDTAGAAARAAAWAAAWAAAGDAAWAAAWAAAGDAAWAAAWDAAWAAAGAAARVAAWAAARDAARDAARAGAEIQGARLLREQGKPFFFLPMFGFGSPEAIPALPADYGIARAGAA
jgi:hypothetical protein